MIVVLVRMNLFLLCFISTPIGLFFLDVFLRGGRSNQGRLIKGGNEVREKRRNERKILRSRQITNQTRG